MRKKIQMIPTILMLMAGAITSIICYILKYEVMAMLLVLIAVMVLFYMLGDVIRFCFLKYVYPPEKTENEETEGEVSDEGAVIEKETAQESKENAKNQKS